ncbi:MAG: hypothetical protein M3R00_07445, partial [Pseudomonadota bacterium]|nr:hypothetical protein [Pseudomonadota bacterium]
IDGSVLCALKNTPLLDEFFNDGAELQNHLVAFFERNGFHVNFDESTDDHDQESSQEEDGKASKELASYIVDNVNARADLKFACPDEYKNDIGILAKIWAQQKKLPADVKQRLDDCRRLEDVQAQGLDVYMLCTVLRAKSSSNLQILPLGEEEGKLVSCAREVYQRTTQLLEKAQDWVNLKQGLEDLDKHLSKAIDAAAMQPHSELIRDSLSILNAEKSILRFTFLHKKITSCFVKNNLAIQDDQELLRWVTQYVETQGENHIVTLTPYTFNRVCWQALTTSPAVWPENLIRLLDRVVLPLIELALNDEDDSIDENNKAFIKHACHKDLEAQLRWLLGLAKNRESKTEDMDNLIIPRLFVPCKLSGFRFKKISSLDALARRLRVSSMRGGRWPVWTDGIDIDRLEFRGNEFNIDDLVQLLLRCPEADCLKILKKGWKFVTDMEGLLKVLQIFELADRHVILQMSKNLLRSVRDFAMILRVFPPVDRKALIVNYSYFIESANILAQIQGLIPPADRFDVALKFSRLYNDFDSFFPVAMTIPLPECLQLIQRYTKLIVRFGQLIVVVEKYSQEPECAALALQCSRVIADDYEMARVLTLLPEDGRMGLVDAYLSKPRTHTKFIDVLKLLRASEQGALLEKYDRLFSFSKFEDLIGVSEFMAKDHFTTLADKYVGLIKYISQLVQVLPLVDADKRVALVEKFYQLTKNRGGLDSILPHLKEEDRVPMVEKHFHTIENGYGLYAVLSKGGIPLSYRRGILERGWPLIEANASIFPLIVTTLPEHHAEEVLEQGLSLVKDGTNIAVATSELTPDRRQYWVDRAWHLVSNGLHVAHLLSYFTDRGRDELVDKGWHLLKNGFQVVDIALRYPDKKERRAIFNRGWNLVVNASQFSSVVQAAHETDYATLLAKGSHLIAADKDFEEFMKFYFISYASSDLQESLIEESMKYLKYTNNPINAVKKLLREWARFEDMRRIIKKCNEEFAMLAEPEACRVLMEPCFQIIQNFDLLKDVVKDCPEKLQLWIVEKCWHLVGNATQLIDIEALLQEKDRAVLIARGADLIEAETGEDISRMFIQDSESPHFSRDSPLNTRRSTAKTEQTPSSKILTP